MRTNHPSILILAGIAGTSAWAPLALGNNPRLGVSPSISSPHHRPIHGSTTTSLSAASTMPPLSSHYEEHLPIARDAMKFIDDSPDPFHAVKSAKNALENVGFVEWKDDEEGADALAPGGKYLFTRNKSTLVAFTVGSNYKPGSGFKIIGSHTDSPNLKVKPYSKRTTTKDGGAMRGDSTCGRVLWRRAVAYVVRSGFGSEWQGICEGWGNWQDSSGAYTYTYLLLHYSLECELVKIDQAILRIPNLAIHLQTTTEREAFKVNKEDHLAPIIATAVKDSLGGKDDKNQKDGDEWMKHQEPLLVQLLASELGVSEKDIVDFELNLFDVQPATLGGVRSEFVHSARLDNLASCFLSLRGLIDHVEDGGLENDSDISMIAMFDHEEVGSSSATGAGSPIVGEAVKRISHALGAGTDCPSIYDRAIQRSFVLSVDQAHAVHPNYAAKHEKNHGPKMNGGMVIKRNANQRYATNGITGLIVRELARRAGLPPVQEFVVRNDCGCGSTIGPIISSATGIRAIDMGCPQLSMHSIRETMGVKDFTHGLALFRAFFNDFSSVDDSIEE
ncbi:hypothetical protein ACHAXR_009939 [Thalassiosira sp. AJA248-18]